MVKAAKTVFSIVVSALPLLVAAPLVAQSRPASPAAVATYSEKGMLSAMSQSIARDRQPPTTLQIDVDLTKWNGRCSSLAYTVVAEGRSLASPPYDGFDKVRLPRTIAFSPVENVGAVIGGGPLDADIRTEMAYDEKNRRTISRQTFGSGNGMFEIAYSDYRWTPNGRRAGYTARIGASTT